MQRLFSNFARGAPGAGLLLLRASCAGSLVSTALGLAQPGAPVQHIGQALAGTLATLLLAGFGTPFVGVAVVIDALLQLNSPGSPRGQWLLLAVIGASLVLLGPGAWSVDAWLFGRRRVELPETSRRRGTP